MERKKLKHIIVYENSFNELNVWHCGIKVTVTTLLIKKNCFNNKFNSDLNTWPGRNLNML